MDVAKGMEPETLLTMTHVIRSDLDRHGSHDNALVALSGPTHAEEIEQNYSICFLMSQSRKVSSGVVGRSSRRAIMIAS